MRKKDWAILLLTAAYSVLFYHQHAGLNFLLFTITVIAAIAALNRDLLKNRRWLGGAFLTLLSGVFVFVHGSSLALLANFVSLIIIASYGTNSQSSVLFSLIQGLYSIGGSLVFIILGAIRKNKNTERDKKTIFSKVLTILVPVLLAIVFMAIYKSANPLFANFTEKIDLSFISFEWLMFTFCGFLIVYGIIHYHKIKRLDTWENNLPLSLGNTGFAASRLDERKAVILLFVLLNIMLLFINLLDVNYLYLGAGMPTGITHKEFVHNGVGMLILSIVLAISTILYFFRGRLNFEDQHHTAKILVYVWIAQNLMMVISTAFRNHLYITEALLTYKRIGVYCWLLMAAIGLVFTFIKLYKQRSTWYLIKTNALIAYVLLIAGAGIDWDKLITNYNFSRINYIASLDKKYLVSLSETNLGTLYTIRNNKEFNTDSLYHYEYLQGYDNTKQLDEKLYRYFSKISNDDWRSFNFRKQRVIAELEALNAGNMITQLDLSYVNTTTLKPVFLITNVVDLNLTDGHLEHLNELSRFKKLESLNLNGNELSDLDSLPAMPLLKRLYLGQNIIPSLNYLDRAPNLEVLNLSDNQLNSLDGLPKLKHLKELQLNGNGISDLSLLTAYPNLQSLSLDNSNTYLTNFPELPALKELHLKNSALLLPYLRPVTLPALTVIDLSSNNLSSTNVLVYLNKDGSTAIKFAGLEALYLQNNNLYSVNDLSVYTHLKTLRLSNNKLRNVNALSGLQQLEFLYLDGNQLQSIDFVSGTPLLKELSLYKNILIHDFAALRSLKNLRLLDISNTGFTDLDVLSATQLEDLNLKDCKLNSFKGIERFKKLKTLYVSNLSGDDVKELLKLKHLKTLYVSRSNYDWFRKLQDELRGTEVKMAY